MKKVGTVLLILILIAVGATVAAGQFTDVFSFKTVGLQDAKSVNGVGIKKVEVDVSSIDVKVVSTTGEEIKVDLAGEVSERYKDDFKLIVKENGDTLKVEIEEPNFRFGTIMINLQMIIELPEKEYESIRLNASSGDFDIKGIRAMEMITEVSSGDIRAEDVTVASVFELDASSGDMRLNNVKAEKFAVSASSGDIRLDGVEGEVSVDTSSGDITVYDAAGNLTLEASSGDITIDNNKVQGNIQAEATSGDVKVSFRDAPTSLSLDFRASSGDGSVNLEEMLFDEKTEDEILGKIGDGKYLLKVRTTSGDFSLN
ncbi:lia operon protein LiaG [Bacillus tianshenii]|uniref:Lia operon protein LiaG n=1 Tax=Sutcliffiella tianshenii TaxID=1463404 RepID=A0ABS2NZ20_9BACI|nr:lia operon protein LiaG [Bacillus tianshenii]